MLIQDIAQRWTMTRIRTWHLKEISMIVIIDTIETRLITDKDSGTKNIGVICWAVVHANN